MAHGSIIFIAELNANGKLLHARSLEILLCIVGHVSAKNTTDTFIGSDSFQPILAILHFFVLLLKNCLELLSLVLIGLSLGNLSLGEPSSRLDGETLAKVINIADALLHAVLHARELASQTEGLLLG